MKRLSQSKVLVTGAGGFIGSHLCELCLAEGADVRAFVHYNSRSDWGMLEDLDKKKLRDIEVVAGDLGDSEAVRRAVKGCSRVFHLGALIGIPYSYQNPADVVATNVVGSLGVLQAAQDAGVERMVQTSTSEVYGTAQYVPMDEKHPLHPQSPYAASKVGSDKLAESFHLTYGLPVVILRPFNTYGPRQSPRAVIPAIITQALKSNTIRLGNLDATRDLTFVRDTAAGFVAAGTAPGVEGATIQLGTQAEHSIRELVGLVAGILGKKLKTVTEDARKRPAKSEVTRLCACNRLARERLGWTPRVGLDEGLEETVRWFRERGHTFDKRGLYHV
ncbi:MAG: SDR family NAD(P)-dependent oxidoreductase [Acidobacteriota bacterium]|jgi:dTDP-glucose 4,6-dehydratase|nr:SDR family NAD(P)-dependent oxidoreductase [Acidobacteriota bacterium]